MRRLWVALRGWLITVGVVIATNSSPEWQGERLIQDYAIFLFFVTAAWTGGYVLHRRSSQARRRACEAVTSERARIARELHDIVAHSVSIIALQAGAAEALVERDPAAAREHLGAVQRMAHDALSSCSQLAEELPTEQRPSYATAASPSNVFASA